MSAKQLRKLEARTAAQNSSVASTAVNSSTTGNPEALDSESDVEHAQSASHGLAAGFAALATSSDESEAGASPESGSVPAPVALKAAISVESPGPKGKAKKGNQKKKLAKRGAVAEKGDATQKPADSDEDALLDGLVAAAVAAEPSDSEQACLEGSSVLAMCRTQFSAERERRRLFGDTCNTSKGAEKRKTSARARGSHAGKFVHHRKLYLVEPGPHEQWPRPEGCAEMVAGISEDGAPIFQLRSTAAYCRVRRDFAEVQLTHDPQELQYLVMERPFCVEALLVLADIARSSGEHDQHLNLIRRAVYAAECNFEAGFSPFHDSGVGAVPRWPRVRLELAADDDDGWPGWPWLAALWAYMLGLHSQGLSRTAIEIGKLLLAMTLPRDPLHTLMHIDVMCLRARQYDFLLSFTQRLGVELTQNLNDVSDFTILRLDCIMPNFAYSTAFARCLAKGGPPDLAALSHVAVADVLPPTAGSTACSPEGDDTMIAAGVHAALMRALLLFPQVLQPLLEGLGVSTDARAPAGSPCRSSWQELFSRRPLSGCNEFRHVQHFLVHALLADAYAKQCAPLWRGDAYVRWLHACVGRLAQMSESPLFDGEFAEARTIWSRAPCCLDLALSKDYKEFSTSEVGAERRAPMIIQRAMNADVAGSASNLRQAMAATATFGQAEEDDEAMLNRALEQSRQAEESRQRRVLIEEQDAELRESLARDQAQPGTDQDAGMSHLLEMGFSEADAQRALAAASGDVAAAIEALMNRT